MRIGVDCRELESGVLTGIGRYLLNFLTCAAEEKPEHDLILYGNQKTSLPRLAGKITLVRAGERSTLWWDQVFLPRALTAGRVDVFLSPYIKGPVCAPCPYVTTIHDLMFLAVPAYARRHRLTHAVFTRWGRFMSSRAAKVITDSEHSKMDIIEFFHIPSEKIEVIPIGIQSGFKPVGDDALLSDVLRKYGISRPYVLYVGNFKPHKNLRRLLEAFRKAVPNAAACRLVLAGADRAHRPALDQAVSALGLAGRVQFPGFIEDMDLPGLYSASELFVLPSLYEGFGLPALEAMACGTAVVASRTSSVPEVVGDAGLLVDPQDVDDMARAIGLLLSDPSARAAAVRRGLERSAQFSLARTSRKILNLLEATGQAV